MQSKVRPHLMFIISALVLACNSKKEYQLVPNGNEIGFEIQSSSPGVFYAFTNSLNDQEGQYLYGINGADSCVELLNKKTKTQTRIPLNWLLKTIGYNYNYGCYVYLFSKKLAWVDSGVSDSLYMVDLSQKQILKSVSKKLEKGYSLYEMMEHFYANKLTKEIVMRIHHPDKRSTFGVFDVRGDQLHLKKEMGFRPSIYQQRDMYLTNGALTVISPDSLLISYHYSDSVDLYVNYNWIKRFEMRSDYSGSFKAFKGQHGDLNAVYTQFLMHQRYDYILFDPRKHLYYRIFVHAEDSSGEIKESEFFSICVFDVQFNKIHEQIFRNNKPYYKGLPFLVGSDVYLYNNRKSERNSLREKAIDKYDGFKLEEI